MLESPNPIGSQQSEAAYGNVKSLKLCTSWCYLLIDFVLGPTGYIFYMLEMKRLSRGDSPSGLPRREEQLQDAFLSIKYSR